MSTRKRLSYILPSILIMAVFFAGLFYPLYATTDTFDTPQNFGTTGTYPDCLNAHGNSSSTPDSLVVTIPDGFAPAYIRFHNNATQTDQTADFFEWYYEQNGSTSSIAHLNGSAHTNSTAATFTYSATANTVTVSSGAQTGSAPYVMRICR